MQTQDADAERVYGWIHAVPLPVALPLKKARVATEPGVAVESLLEAGVALLHLLGAVVLLDCAAEGRLPRAFNPQHAARPTEGTWRVLLEQAGAVAQAPTIPRLAALLAEPAQRAALMACFATVIDVRNRRAHGKPDVSRARAEADRALLLQALAGLHDHLGFLAKVVLLRVADEDLGTGAQRFVPLMGPDPVRSAIEVSWPDRLSRDDILLCGVGAEQRWLSMTPLLRWTQGRLMAYQRWDAGRAVWHAVDGSGQEASRPESDRAWLLGRLENPHVTRRGVVALAAEDVWRLADLGQTRQHVALSSGELATVGFTPVGYSPVAKAPESLSPLARGAESWASESTAPPAEASGAPASVTRPVERRAGRGVGLQVGIAAALLGALAMAGLLTWPWLSERLGLAAEAQSAPAGAAAKPAIEPWVSADQPPEAVVQRMNGLYNAGDVAGVAALFLDPIECFYGVRDGFPLSKRSRAATPDRERFVRQVEVVARKGDEALLCERFAMVGRGQSAESPRSWVVYWGARKVEGRWRLFAEAGSHPTHQGQPPKDSRCVAWLAERFEVAEPMSALGQTRCGPMP